MAAPESTDAFRRCAQPVLDELCRYLDESRAGEVPVVKLAAIPELQRQMDLSRWMREGGLDADTVGGFVRRFLDGSTRLHHPGYIAHQLAPTHFAAALADLICGTIDNGMSIFEMGPSAGAVEVAVIDWMLGKVGWPPSGRGEAQPPAGATPASGVLTHGGSMANLTALVAARAQAAPEAWTKGTPDDLVLLAPAHSHYATVRAAALLGLGADKLVPLPADPFGRVLADGLADELAATVDRVQAEGRRVMAVCANACATATGWFDPLEAMGAFCRERDLWFHVDGAHGASHLLSERDRHRLAGIGLADSVVWDAHKLLQTSALCAAVLVRDAATLRAAFPLDAAYIVDELADVGTDVIEHQLECTKSPLGLKLALVLAFTGEEGMARHVDALTDRARELAALIDKRPGFDILGPPESNIVCFRHTATDDEGTARVRRMLLRDGAFHLTQADVAGRRWLRLTVMNRTTDASVLDRLLEAILHAVKALGH